MSPREWAAAGKFPAPAASEIDKMSIQKGNFGPQLVDGEGKEVRVLCRTVLQRPPSRWNDDPRQALTASIMSEQLGDWLSQLESCAVHRMDGPLAAAVRENCFGERCVRAKVSPMFRYYTADGAIAPMPELWSTPAAAFKPTEFWTLLRANVYEVSGHRGVSLKVLATQPV